MCRRASGRGDCGPFQWAPSFVPVSVYVVAALGLLAFAAVSLFTGFRVRFLPFRLCPFIFTASAILILVGGVLI